MSNRYRDPETGLSISADTGSEVKIYVPIDERMLKFDILILDAAQWSSLVSGVTYLGREGVWASSAVPSEPVSESQSPPAQTDDPSDSKEPSNDSASQSPTTAETST